MKINKYLYMIALLTISLANNTYAQNAEAQQKRQYVVAPSDFAVAAAVVQPACPIEFVKTQLLIDVDNGRWVPSFKIRNRGTKPIRAFTLSFGANEQGWVADSTSGFLMPGKVTSLRYDQKAEIVPLTAALRERLKLTGPMQGIYMLLVVDVAYADGSHFQETGYEPLQDYVTTVNSLYVDFLHKSPPRSLTQKEKQ